MAYTTTADGTQLYYKTWGEGRPVFLMHGWPLTADSFDDLSLAIAKAGMRAIAYDRRGFGRSDQPWTGYDYDTFADDLACVMKAVGAQNAALVGFSMGGGEVARYMSRHRGEGVSQAVLISSVVPYMLQTEDNPKGVPQATFDEMTQGMTEDRAKFFAGFFKDFYGIGLIDRPVSEQVIEWSRQMTMQAGLHPTLAAANAFATTDFRGDLDAFQVPTLVIHGTDDKTVPIDTAGRAAARGISQATLIEYDGAPHGVFASHKERLIEDVLAFLARVGR
ncbi:alpha/beta fold hydrolase [Variovorax ginsengisoli]|uniref:Pimeloyl-ACP methyl ester carboxylesterase n=1 Tax=Variovorax ginsengisoli TaxID=363844 RepID=A0ABT9SF22_9BURK|nr:alpha/beta hydrolase [Variovorax ginsengisoli]MDP9902966.1 pimeloyl-ACP methyl ester carboxylesterase [Variovorax ginsengisoli]